MGHVLNILWYDRAFRTQLLIAIGAINLAALIVAGAIFIANARNATRVEMEASVELAKNFARVAIQSLSPDGQAVDLSNKINQLSSRLRIGHLRHVRISVANTNGDLVQLSPEPEVPRDPTLPAPAPDWFAAMVAPDITARTLSFALSRTPAGSVVMVEQSLIDGQSRWAPGTVVITGEPADEIAEVWHDVASLALVLAALDVLALVTLYVVLKRMLQPMDRVARGLTRLEDGDYATRLTPPRVKELGTITTRFNRLAENLGRTRAENGRLCGQLITIQENERREIANELHDEASPCLFGIMANAMSVQKLNERRRDKGAADIRGHMSEILRVTDRLKLMNRVMLKRLRPVSIGRIALSELTRDLLHELQRRYAHVDITLSLRTRDARYGEAIDLAVYRCVQEGVTNAIRHGDADTIRVDLFEEPILFEESALGGTARTLTLLIQDNGKGLTPDTSLGFGLTAMRERVHALAGSWNIEDAPARGTILQIVIPVAADAGRTGPAKQFERTEAI